MIKLLYGIGILILFPFIWTLHVHSEPYSPSCQIALEKVIKARKDLLLYHQTLELAEAQERGAYADMAVCAGGGIFSVGRAIACNDASWNAPQRTKDVIKAEDDYLQERKAFEKFFEHAREKCLFEP